MKCKTAERQMALAVGEDLSPAENQELQRHLQDCSNCRQTWEQQRRGFAVLQNSRTNELQRKSDSVWPVLSHRLRERNAAPQRGEFNGWIAALAVTAACVLMFVFSQDDSRSMTAQQQRGAYSRGMLVSSPGKSESNTRPLLRQDDVQRKRAYNPAPSPDRE